MWKKSLSIHHPKNLRIWKEKDIGFYECRFASTTSTSTSSQQHQKLPGKSDVVICGAGLSGLSVGYHLAKRGVQVSIFDRDCIGGSQGATGACVGIMTTENFFADVQIHKIVQDSVSLYETLAKQHHFVLNKNGRVYLASSDDAVWNVRRMYARSAVFGSTDSELIDDPSEMLSRWPMLETEDIHMAFYTPDDICLDTRGLCRALASEITKHGGKIFENIAVQKVLVGEGQKVYAVETDHAGYVETKNFVNSAGIWTNLIKIANMHQKARVACHPCTYSILNTTKLPNSCINDMTPVIVDLDKSFYMRATDYQTVVGGFHETDISALNQPNAIQHDWSIPPPDWDRFYPVLKQTLARCPPLGQLEPGELVSSAEAYTPDMFPIIGEIEQIGGYYVLNGFNGKGLPYAGGMGKILSDIIVDGFTNADISKVDVTRFLSLHSNPQYLLERVPEVASNTFNVIGHHHQCHTARNLRMSPIYHQLRSVGAQFGEIMGYERPLWFTSNTDPTRNALHSGQDPLVGKPKWFSNVAKEYEACRERVGLIDMTSFSKFEVGGPDAVTFLQKICSGNIDKPVGSTVYTGMQNENGGYVTDCTMSRIEDDKFFIVAPTIQQLRCLIWMKKWAKEWGSNVYVNDVTSTYTALNVVGPASRYLMQDVTGQKMRANDFPSFAYREINIGMATDVKAISVTHCGELGWVLYIPNEAAQNVYDNLVAAGKEYSLAHAGYYALRHLRIEKFYVYWGQDIHTLVTPVECGRSFRVDFNKDFIGKKALMKQMDSGVNKRFIQLLINKHDPNSDPWPQGNELIFRNGVPSGWTTSAAYGFTLGCQVCIGFLENNDFGVSNDWVLNGEYEVDIANKRFTARVNLHSPSLPMISSEHPHHFLPTR
uniref:Pyruvate dehydrogenase phosphatase regulatory subunit, mitochondrial n=1 Tax=Panagrolaimus sp. ES5 TaxID=591445 RepID=A0AC34FMU9_9BILA